MNDERMHRIRLMAEISQQLGVTDPELEAMTAPMSSFVPSLASLCNPAEEVQIVDTFTDFAKAAYLSSLRGGK